MIKKILFVCKHNRFRSKVAEAIFKKLNKNKGIKVRSAGLIMDLNHKYIEPLVLKIMEEKGYEIKGKPKQLTRRMIEKSDMVIIVAKNVNKNIFSLPNKIKIEKWDIPDADAFNEEKIRKIIESIEERVKELVKRV